MAGSGNPALGILWVGWGVALQPGHQHRNRVNEQTHQRAHNGSVNADVLQVLTHVELDLVCSVLSVPACDRIRNN